MEKNKGILKKVSDGFKDHLVTSTALVVESTPIFAAFEVGLAGMPDDVSWNARLFSAGLTYLGGAGYFFSKGRDLSKKLFNIGEASGEKLHSLNDAFYNGFANLAISPLIYLASGSRDLNEIALGTAAAVGFGLVNGAPACYSIDLFKDLTELKDCERQSYPSILKKQNSKIKKSLAALLVAGTMALTAGIYALNHDKENNLPQIQYIQENVNF